MKPIVSIVTVTFQAESLLERTMQSVLEQTYNGIEYLVIDGGSQDGTTELIQKYESTFREKGIHFQWLSEFDNGLYDAMNKALNIAKGEYVWFMNAGDSIASGNVLSNIIQQLSNAFQADTRNLPDFLYGETTIVDEKGNIMGGRRLKAPENLTWKSFKMGMLVCHQSMLIKRSTAPIFDLQYRYSADFDWAIRCLRQAKGIYNTHLVLSHFLDGGISKKKMKASLKERFQIMSINYGLIPTVLRHGWFVCRAFWFKLWHGWI